MKKQKNERSPEEIEAARIFGRSLRRLREDRQLDAKDLAGAVLIHVDTLYKYERGEREPTILKILQLAQVLGVTLERLLTGEQKRPVLRVMR